MGLGRGSTAVTTGSTTGQQSTNTAMSWRQRRKAKSRARKTAKKTAKMKKKAKKDRETMKSRKSEQSWGAWALREDLPKTTKETLEDWRDKKLREHRLKAPKGMTNYQAAEKVGSWLSWAANGTVSGAATAVSAPIVGAAKMIGQVRNAAAGPDVTQTSEPESTQQMVLYTGDDRDTMPSRSRSSSVPPRYERDWDGRMIPRRWGHESEYRRSRSEPPSRNRRRLEVEDDSDSGSDSDEDDIDPREYSHRPLLLTYASSHHDSRRSSSARPPRSRQRWWPADEDSDLDFGPDEDDVDPRENYRAPLLLTHPSSSRPSSRRSSVPTIHYAQDGYGSSPGSRSTNRHPLDRSQENDYFYHADDDDDSNDNDEGFYQPENYGPPHPPQKSIEYTYDDEDLDEGFDESGYIHPSDTQQTRGRSPRRSSLEDRY